jgi:hypothetical protein
LSQIGKNRGSRIYAGEMTLHKFFLLEVKVFDRAIVYLHHAKVTTDLTVQHVALLGILRVSRLLHCDCGQEAGADSMALGGIIEGPGQVQGPALGQTGIIL